MTKPAPVLLSLYNAFPRRTGRARALDELQAALDRIASGEIDGQPRTAEEAIAFLRERIDQFRTEMVGREKKHIAHPSTYLHQSKYLRTTVALAPPKRLTVCAEILAMYPKMPAREYIEAKPDAFLPALHAIETLIDGQPASFVQYLAERTSLYAFRVSRWAPEDLQYVPGPGRWFGERRFEHDERQWQRNAGVGYQEQRDQLQRLFPD